MLIYSDTAALQVIGICISILGIVSAIVIANQRINSVVDPSLLKLQKEKQKYSVTRKDTPKARIKVIENFDERISSDDLKYGMPDLADKTEGFKVVGKSSVTSTDDAAKGIVNDVSKANSSPSSTAGSESQPRAKADHRAIPKDYQDLESEILSEGFRVVGKNSGKSSSKTNSSVNNTKENHSVPGNEVPIFDIEPKVPPKDKAIPDQKGESNSNVSPSNEISMPQGNLDDFNWNALIDEEIFPSNHPKKELDFFVQRILRTTLATSECHTVSFVLYDSEKNLMKIESLVSDSPNSIVNAKRIAIGSDILSTIVTSAKPTIISSIAEGSANDLIPYYNRNIPIRSFIGIPITYSGTVVGVLSLDSKEEKAFNELTATYLGHTSKLLSGLLQSYSEKFDLKQMAESYTAINNFRLLSSDSNVGMKEISHSLSTTINNSLEPQNIGIVLFDHELNHWKINNYLSVDDKSYDGIAISEASPLSGSIENGELQVLYKQAKIVLNESQDLQFSRANDVFIVPIRTESSIFGCFFISVPPRQSYGPKALQMMEVLAEYSAIAIEKIYLSKIIRDNAFYNSVTGLLNKKAFLDRLESESRRAKDFEYDSSLLILKVDHYEAYSSDVSIDHAIAEFVSHIISTNVRGYDFVGNFDDVFFVSTVRTGAENARIWSEKIKNNIATETLQIKDKEYNVTVSIGILQYGSSYIAEPEDMIKYGLGLMEQYNSQSNSVALYS
jgi:diguanylate cyclase (GGDEF)-like protein